MCGIDMMEYTDGNLHVYKCNSLPIVCMLMVVSSSICPFHTATAILMPFGSYIIPLQYKTLTVNRWQSNTVHEMVEIRDYH